MFKPGNTPWNKGLKAETFKMREYKTRLNIPHSEEAKEKMRQAKILYYKDNPGYWEGKNLSEETKKKISRTKKSQKLKLTMKHRRKISQGLKRAGVTQKNRDRKCTVSRMDWKEWRRAVLERGKHQCQICFLDEKLVAHHIVPYRTNISLKYDVDNGLTMCRNCHIELHRTSLLIKKAVNTGKLQLLFKLIEALDNPVPSGNGNISEGVTTNSRVLRDSNANTSAVAKKKARDSLSQVVTSGSDV